MKSVVQILHTIFFFFVFSVYLQMHKIKEDLNDVLLGSKKHNLTLLQGFYIATT